MRSWSSEALLFAVLNLCWGFENVGQAQLQCYCCYRFLVVDILPYVIVVSALTHMNCCFGSRPRSHEAWAGSCTLAGLALFGAQIFSSGAASQSSVLPWVLPARRQAWAGSSTLTGLAVFGGAEVLNSGSPFPSSLFNWVLPGGRQAWTGLVPLRAWRCLVLRSSVQPSLLRVHCFLQCCQVEDRLGLVVCPYRPGVVWCWGPKFRCRFSEFSASFGTISHRLGASVPVECYVRLESMLSWTLGGLLRRDEPKGD